MKKIIILSIVLIFALSLTACGRVMNDVTSGAESIGDAVISGTQSATDKVESAVGDDKKSMNLMAGITAKQARDAALKRGT